MSVTQTTQAAAEETRAPRDETQRGTSLESEPAQAQRPSRPPSRVDFFHVEEARDAHGLFEQALLADRREEWGNALTLYAQASSVLRERESIRPSRPLGLGIDKAEQERRASLRLLELLGSERVPRAVGHSEPPGNEDPRLEAGRLLRRKVALMLAAGQPLPAALAQHARILLQEVSRVRSNALTAATEAVSLAGPAAELERCTLEATVSARPRARLALARVPRAKRELPPLAGAMAACRATLGEEREALRYLIAAFGELPPPGPEDDRGLGTTTWRELLLLDDWNELRGDPAFQRLFAPPD